MTLATRKSGRRKRDSKEDTKASILAAATHDFAQQGPAGARIGAIAKRAGVNIALVYYYYSSKSQLYHAVLEDVFRAWFERMAPVLSPQIEPRESIIMYVETHFDFLAEAPLRANLIQAELSRRDARLLRRIENLTRQYVRPVHASLAAALLRGAQRQQLRPVDPVQAALTINGLVTSYFTAAPLIGALHGSNPLSKIRLQRRKEAIVDFVRTSIFLQRKSSMPRNLSS